MAILHNPVKVMSIVRVTEAVVQTLRGRGGGGEMLLELLGREWESHGDLLKGVADIKVRSHDLAAGCMCSCHVVLQGLNAEKLAAWLGHSDIDDIIAGHVTYCHHVLRLQLGQTAIVSNGRVGQE